jgi:hypothetical protein
MASDGTSEPKSPALQRLYWRDEILQVMFWIRGEGLGDDVDELTLERFLGVEATTCAEALERLVDEALLEPTGDARYRLSPTGQAHGARIFAEEFADLTRPGHGECGADCWCHASIEEAEACHEERNRTRGG